MSIMISIVVGDDVFCVSITVYKSDGSPFNEYFNYYSIDEYEQYRHFTVNPEAAHDYYSIRGCADLVRELARANNCEGLLNKFGFVLTQGEFDELNSCRYNDLYSDYRNNSDIKAVIEKGLLFVTESRPWKPDRKFIITDKGREALEFFHWMKLPF